MKRAIVFEGGGAKGAYEAGAVKALNKKKIFFDGAGGTSIGAINAAFYVVKNFDNLFKLWEKMDSSDIFGVDSEFLQSISSFDFKNKELTKKGIESIKKIFKNNGVDIDNIHKLLSKYIKEDRFRRSKIDFAVATFNISDRKPTIITKEDIPEGKLIECIIASAYLPIFKFEKIVDGKFYLDGGVFNNCPVDTFIERGFDEIYAIQDWHNSKVKYTKKKGVKVHIIKPREDLGSILLFNTDMANYRMNLGYYDTLKYLDNLDGKNYYFKNYSEEYYRGLFDKVTYKRMIKKYNKGFEPKSYKDFVISIVEKLCKQLNYERFKIYNMPYLLTRIKYKMVSDKNNAYYDFIKNIKVDFE